VVTGSVTPTPTGTALRITDDQAAQLLIGPDDLPTPYQVDPAVSPDSRVGLPPGCTPLDAFTAAMRHAPVRAARGFVGGSVYPFLEEHVAVLPGTAAAQVAQFSRVLAGCRTFVSRDADGVGVRFTTSPLLTLDTAGQASADEVVAVGMAGRPALTSDAVTAQAVVVRRGDVVVLFVLSGLDKIDTDVLTAALGKATSTLDRF
jgi:hypothetical protein